MSSAIRTYVADLISKIASVTPQTHCEGGKNSFVHDQIMATTERNPLSVAHHRHFRIDFNPFPRMETMDCTSAISAYRLSCQVRFCHFLATTAGGDLEARYIAGEDVGQIGRYLGSHGNPDTRPAPTFVGSARQHELLRREVGQPSMTEVGGALITTLPVDLIYFTTEPS